MIDFTDCAFKRPSRLIYATYSSHLPCRHEVSLHPNCFRAYLQCLGHIQFEWSNSKMVNGKDYIWNTNTKSVNADIPNSPPPHWKYRLCRVRRSSSSSRDSSVCSCLFRFSCYNINLKQQPMNDEWYEFVIVRMRTSCVCPYMQCMASCIMALHVMRSSLLLASTSTISGFCVPAVIRNRPAGDTSQPQEHESVFEWMNEYLANDLKLKIKSSLNYLVV